MNPTERCHKCCKEFFSKYTLQTHLNKIKPCISEYRCDDCGQLFNLKTQYDKHKKTYHKDYSCKYCSSKSTTRSNQRRHERTCKKKYDYDIIIKTQEQKDIICKMQEQINKMQNKIDELSISDDVKTINNVSVGQININNAE